MTLALLALVTSGNLYIQVIYGDDTIGLAFANFSGFTGI